MKVHFTGPHLNDLIIILILRARNRNCLHNIGIIGILRSSERWRGDLECLVPARASEGQVAVAWSPHRQSTQDVTTRGNAVKTSPSTLIMSTILRLESFFISKMSNLENIWQ